MVRDEFSCASCGSEDKTLNVHHKTYRKNADPWDYDDDNFITLCECCHKSSHEMLDDIKRRIFYPPIGEVFYEVLNNEFYEEFCIASLQYMQQYENEKNRAKHLARMNQCIAYYNEAKAAGEITEKP